MEECSRYFDGTGILFHESFEDQAIRYVWTDPDLNYLEKKELILCWFDVTYGNWEGNRFDQANSRKKMAEYLARQPYSTYEELIASTELIQNHAK